MMLRFALLLILQVDVPKVPGGSLCRLIPALLYILGESSFEDGLLLLVMEGPDTHSGGGQSGAAH